MQRRTLIRNLAAFLAAPWLLGKPGPLSLLGKPGLPWPALGDPPPRLTRPDKSVCRRG